MGELAKNNIGSIYICPHKVVHINCKGLSLHFTEEAFLEFSQLVKEAFSKLVDINLADLTKDF